LNIYGTSAATPSVSGTGIGTQDMAGNALPFSNTSLYVHDRAHVYIHYNDKQLGTASLVLGDGVNVGNSIVSNSYMNIDRGSITGASNTLHFTDHAYFEGSNWKDLVDITPPINPANIVNDTNGLDAAIRSYNYNTGGGSSVTTPMEFTDSAVFAPGFGSQALYEEPPTFNSGYWTE
jgi:hypothetical protein